MSNYITFEDFKAKYRPIPNIENGGDNMDAVRGYCYKQDHDSVLALANTGLVWTMIDSEDGTKTIVPGYRLANRIAYIITEVPFSTKDFNEGLTVKH